MNKSEWLEIAAGINDFWPTRQLPDATIAAWFTILEELPTEQIIEALSGLVKEGRPFPPAVGEIYQAALALNEPGLIWREIWQELRDLAIDYGAEYYDPAIMESTPDDERYTMEGYDRRIPFSHPLVREFAMVFGWKEFLANVDPEGVAEAQGRRAWEAFLGRRKHDDTLAKSESGLPRIVEARRRVSTRLTDIKRLTRTREIG